MYQRLGNLYATQRLGSFEEFEGWADWQAKWQGWRLKMEERLQDWKAKRVAAKQAHLEKKLAQASEHEKKMLEKEKEHLAKEQEKIQAKKEILAQRKEVLQKAIEELKTGPSPNAKAVEHASDNAAFKREETEKKETGNLKGWVLGEDGGLPRNTLLLLSLGAVWYFFWYKK